MAFSPPHLVPTTYSLLHSPSHPFFFIISFPSHLSYTFFPSPTVFFVEFLIRLPSNIFLSSLNIFQCLKSFIPSTVRLSSIFLPSILSFIPSYHHSFLCSDLLLSFTPVFVHHSILSYQPSHSLSIVRVGRHLHSITCLTPHLSSEIFYHHLFPPLIRRVLLQTQCVKVS